MSEVWVVGGGPSGLSTAIAIKVNNPDMNVWVLDKDYPGFAGRPQRCAGGVSQWFLDRVGLFRLPNDVVSSVVHRFRVYAPNMKDCWEIKTEKPLGYVIDRNLFECWLVAQAQKVGALIRNYNVTSEVLHRCEADYIVGADGPHSTVAKWAGASKPPLDEVYHCVQKTIKWCGYPRDTIEVYFSNEIVPRGYAWCFPAGKDRARVGLGVPLASRLNPSRLLEDFMVRRGFSDVEDLEFISKLVPTAKPRKSNVFMNGRVMLVGDAGLHTDPLLGGGIVQGIIAGEACGRAIAEGDPFLFDRYVNWLTKHNRWRYKLKKILISFSDQDLAKLVEKLKPPEEPVSVGKELKRVVRQLMWRKPSVILKLLLG